MGFPGDVIIMPWSNLGDNEEIGKEMFKKDTDCKIDSGILFASGLRSQVNLVKNS